MRKASNTPREIHLMLSGQFYNNREIRAGIYQHALPDKNWVFIFHDQSVHTLKMVATNPRCEGLIGRFGHPALAKVAAGFRSPVINIHGGTPMEGLPMIGPSSMEVGRYAAQTLRSQGAHSFAFYGVKNADFSEAILRGFREGLGALEEDCHLFLEEPGVFSHRELFEKQLAWIRKLPDGTAIYCPDDVFAHTVGCLAIQSGRRIPEDLTLLGTNNDETLCLGMQPPISSIRLPWRRIGYRAAELLEELMDGGTPSAEPEYFGPPELVRRQSLPERHCHDPLVERAISLMHEHLANPLTIEELARKVGASRRSLEKRFRKTVDRSPLHEQNRIRLEEVKRLLREDARTIEALSDVLGFSSPVYLHQFFQREAGMSPGAYRKSFSAHPDPR